MQVLRREGSFVSPLLPSITVTKAALLPGGSVYPRPGKHGRRQPWPETSEAMYPCKPFFPKPLRSPFTVGNCCTEMGLGFQAMNPAFSNIVFNLVFNC